MAPIQITDRNQCTDYITLDDDSTLFFWARLVGMSCLNGLKTDGAMTVFMQVDRHI